MQPEDAYRLLIVPDGADPEAEREAYRERTGYQGPIILLSEADARL